MQELRVHISDAWKKNVIVMYGSKDLVDEELIAREEKLEDYGSDLEDQITGIDEELREIHAEMKKRGIKSEYSD